MELKLIIDDLDIISVTNFGDFNANLVNPSHPHGHLLRRISDENGLVISSEQLLPVDSFTFISEMSPSETYWLDHCVSSQDEHNIINKMYVNFNISCRDHIPVVVGLGLDSLPIVGEVNDVAPKIKWEKCDAVKLREYSLMSDIYLSKLTIPNEALECRDIKCKEEGHTYQIKLFYENICKCFVNASKDVLEVNKKEIKKIDCKPGFTEYVKDLHDRARNCLVAW